jgi:hypothetical protein
MDQPLHDDASARITELLGQILDRVEAIDGRQAALEARLDAIEAGPPAAVDAAPAAPAPPQVAGSPGSTPPTRPVVSRRMLLTGAAGLTAAGVAAVAGATPAAATNGQPILAGQNNTATAATTISASGSATSALDAINTNFAGAGLYGQTNGASGLAGAAFVAGVIGDSEAANGVVGTSRFSRGMLGVSIDDIGVVGSGGAAGVRGASEGLGVEGATTTGVALAADSRNVHLQFTSFGRSAPTSDTRAHVRGQMVYDDTGGLWFCVADGIPGTWRRISGPGSAGAFHVLPAPARIYDSRPGTAPNVGSKTPLNNTPRALSCNVNSSGVPAGATAVALTILLVNAANANGNMTVWANGAPRPQANTMVWGAGSGRSTSSTISAVDAQTRIQVVASASTDVVIDVLGYYR